MKKIFVIIVSIFLLISISGCSGNDVEKEKNILSGKTLSFSGKDLNGNKITKDLLKDYDLIVINKWGTSCNPCVQEMPDLQKIQDEFKNRKVKVIGVISMDKEKNDEKSLIDDAKKITSIKKINYLNILPDKKFNEQLNKFDFVPVTLFVKPDGKVLDTYITGATKYDYFKKLIDSALKGELK
ncbi:TlpA family protein disulfide reductase [Clostridium brassicae]|uniref:TlpA disulfide reductase family protein n=1 Tax=Clostridium brassicae TaxID=2999072 RepID=A0ABT4D8A8_9CLOT|nr:TlpA disulfide reductase family protein [Clostridium brassicae]MCY6958528.1 TlpA disulfide reductase family protein [Clostridium brassicae]